jgi:transcription-repair coupling factor (superfamily II helicase)
VKLLAEAVRELRGDAADTSVDPVVNVDVEAYLPESYVPEVNQRLALYKRLAEIERPEEVVDARAELADRYGPLPPAVEGLLDVIGLRVTARELGVERVEAGGGRAILTFAPSTKVTPERMLRAIAASRGGLALKKEYTVEARIPTEPWPAVRDALVKLLDSLR